MSSLLRDAKLEALLDRLHSESEAEVDELVGYYRRRRSEDGSSDRLKFDDDMHRFLSDKMVALDRDKCEFCYQLCRALRATRVVEAGTSFGVSTLYLAAAVRDNGVEDGIVIGTEYEPKKASAARENFRKAQLESFIELREGDLRMTLKGIDGPVDFVLLDIWEVALPALELVSPHLREGAVVVADNTSRHCEQYHQFFQFVAEPSNQLRRITVPFDGGLELIVRG